MSVSPTLTNKHPNSGPASSSMECASPLSAKTYSPIEAASSGSKVKAKIPLKQLLIDSGVINSEGLLIAPDTLPPVPSLDLIDYIEVQQALHQIVTVKTSEGETKLSLHELLLHTYNNAPRLLPAPDLPQLFGMSRLVTAAVMALTGQSAAEVKPYVAKIASIAKEKKGQDFLKEVIRIKTPESEMTLSLNEVYTQIYWKCPIAVPEIEIIGGYVRKLLLSSERYMTAILVSLTKLSAEEVKPYVDQIVAEAKQQKLPDIDIRVHSSIITEEALGSFTQSLVNFFSYKLQCSPYKARQEAFSKFNLVFDEKNQFSIATVKPEGTFEFEMLFVGSLKRNHLFTHDSLRLSILPFLLGQGKMTLESDYGQPWQPITDLLTKTVHVFNPETVDLFGFPLLMSFHTKGHSAGSAADVKTLASKVTQVSQYHVGIPEQVAGLLTTTCRNHLHQDPIAALALTVNTCLHLDISPMEHHRIWKQMRETYWKEVDLSHAPLFKAIDQAVIERNIPFRVISAALSIYRTGHDSVEDLIKVKGTNTFIKPPLTSKEALDILSEHLFDNPELQWLSQILHHEPNTSKANSDHLLERGMALLQSKSRPQRCLGFFTLLKLGGIKSHSHLLKHFVDVLSFIPKEERPSFIERMTEIPELAPVVTAFTESIRPDHNESKLLCAWITALSRKPDTLKIACELWLKYRKKFPKKHQFSLDAILMDQLLPLHFDDALRLLQSGQNLSNPRLAAHEMELLAKLLPLVNALPEGRFATVAPRMQKFLTFTLTKATTKRAKGAELEPFTKAFASFIERLLGHSGPAHASELVDLAMTHPCLTGADPYLYRCELQCLDQMNGAPETTLRKWKKIQAYGQRPSDLTLLHQKVHRKVIAQLTDDEHLEGEGFRQLEIYSESADPDPELTPLIVRDISRLVASDAETSAVQLLNEVFHKHLSAESLATEREKLFDQFLKRGELERAYKQWQEIKHCRPATTVRLLDKLIAKKTAGKHLSAAVRILRKEIGDELLSPEDKLAYFLSIHQLNSSDKLLRYIVGYCLDTPMDNGRQLDVVKRALKRLTKPGEDDHELIDTVKSRAEDLLRILEDAQEIDQIETLIKALDDRSISIDFHPISCRLSDHYINCKQHGRALIWMKRTDPSKPGYHEWLAQRLTRYQEMKPKEEAEALQTFSESINAFSAPSPFIERAHTLVVESMVPSRTSLELLTVFPPASITPWEPLITSCSKRIFPLVWEKFHGWLGTSASIEPEARPVVLKAIQRLAEVESPLETELIETVDSPDTPLGKIAETSVDRMEMKGKLIISRAKKAKSVPDISSLYDPLESEANAQSLSTYCDLSLELIHVLIEKKDKSSLEYACKIFGRISYLWTSSDSSSYKSAMTDTLLQLMQRTSRDQKMDNSDQTALLVYASKRLREKYPGRFPAIKAAMVLSQFNTPFVLDECVLLLQSVDDCAESKEVWGKVLPGLMRREMESEKPEAATIALTLYQEHVDKLNKASTGHIQCSDIVFDIAVRLLDKEEDLSMFGKLLPMHLSSCFDERNVFLTILEMPISSLYSPVFHCRDEATGPSKAFFFNRITTLLSKILDTDRRESNIEGFAHHFMTKNLTSLCDHFPEKTEILIPLLDRYYYRYPPEFSMFYGAHISFSLRLWKHAASKGIYSSSGIINMCEAGMFLEDKPVFPQKSSIEEKTVLIERTIDRFVASGSPHAIVRAVRLMQESQRLFIHHRPRLKRIYLKLIDAISVDPFYIFEQCTLFEWIRKGLMNGDDPVAGFSKEEQGRSTATDLCERLFHKVFQLSQNPDLFAKEPVVTEINLLDWLTKLLILSGQHGGYLDRNGPERYYKLVDSLVPEIIRLSPKMTDSQRSNFMGGCTRAIIGEVFERVKTLPKKVKQKRSTLMRGWLTTFDSNVEQKKVQLELADSYKVFETTPKDRSKVVSNLKKGDVA